VGAELVRAIFGAAVAAMDPAARVRAALAGATGLDGPLAVAAVGKAAAAMARGAADALGDAARRAPGLVVVPPGPWPADLPWPVQIASHPVPDATSEAAGRALLALAASVPADGALLALVSGGASALAAVPASGLSLATKIAATRAVYAAGAPIAELNAVRAALSAIKGGRMAAACPAPVVTLVTSDVVGDDVAVVGSGPTVGPWTARVVSLHEATLEVDVRGRDRVMLIAGVGDLARAAAAAATARRLPARVWSEGFAGDVGTVADGLIAELQRAAPGVVVGAGEATLALAPQPGQGGRARHLALLVARALAGRRGVTVLVAGSDGVDGTGPAAGAIVDGDTWQRLRDRGLDGDAALAACDSGTALAAIGADVVTGPTGINHCDLVVAHLA